jgi:hypothetical protein
MSRLKPASARDRPPRRNRHFEPLVPIRQLLMDGVHSQVVLHPKRPLRLEAMGHLGDAKAHRSRRHDEQSFDPLGGKEQRVERPRLDTGAVSRAGPSVDHGLPELAPERHATELLRQADVELFDECARRAIELFETTPNGGLEAGSLISPRDSSAAR